MEPFLEAFSFGARFLRFPYPTRAELGRPQSPHSTLQHRLTLYSLLRFDGFCNSSASWMTFGCTNIWASPAKRNFFLIAQNPFNNSDGVVVVFGAFLNEHKPSQWTSMASLVAV